MATARCTLWPKGRGWGGYRAGSPAACEGLGVPACARTLCVRTREPKTSPPPNPAAPPVCHFCLAQVSATPQVATRASGLTQPRIPKAHPPCKPMHLQTNSMSLPPAALPALPDHHPPCKPYAPCKPHALPVSRAKPGHSPAPPRGADSPPPQAPRYPQCPGGRVGNCGKRLPLEPKMATARCT